MEITNKMALIIIIIINSLILLVLIANFFKRNVKIKYIKKNHNNAYYGSNKKSKIGFVINVAGTIINIIFTIVSCQCLTTSIDFTHTDEIHNNETISLTSSVFWAKIYYTVDKEPLQEKSVAYDKNEKIKVSDLDLSKVNLKGNDNKFTIYSQLKFLGMWVGQVEEIDYRIVYNFNPTIEFIDHDTTNEDTAFNASIPIEETTLFDSIYINNQQEMNRINRLCDGNTKTYEGFVSYGENCIEFESSENKKIQTIYIYMKHFK